jgi:hypothetical protein
MKLTHFEDKISSCEADSLSASQEIPPFLWNLISHCRNHSCPSSLHIPIRMNPLRTLFFQVAYFLRSDFPGNNLFVFLIFAMFAACLAISSSLI